MIFFCVLRVLMVSLVPREIRERPDRRVMLVPPALRDLLEPPGLR